MHEAYKFSLIGEKIQLESFDWPDFRIIFFRQIITFIKVHVAIVFGLQILKLIDFKSDD